MYVTKMDQMENEMWWTADKHNYMCHICAKIFLDSNFDQAVIDKISVFVCLFVCFLFCFVFHEIALNFTYSQKS